MASKVKVVLRSADKSKNIDYDIIPHDHQLSNDWIAALKGLLSGGYVLEKNYCWHGFPKTSRDLPYLCDQLNRSIEVINQPYVQHG